MAEFGRLSGVQFLLIAEFKYFAALRALDSHPVARFHLNGLGFGSRLR